MKLYLSNSSYTSELIGDTDVNLGNTLETEFCLLIDKSINKLVINYQLLIIHDQINKLYYKHCTYCRIHTRKVTAHTSGVFEPIHLK